jgi:LysM repeat protein
MKPVFPLLLALCAWMPLDSPAQDSAFAEERYKILSDKVNHLTETQELIRKRQEDLRERLESLSGEIRRMKEDYARSGVNLVTAEQLKAVVEKLQEVDRKREADNQAILKNMSDLARLGASSIPDKASSKQPIVEAPEGYWKYEVKSGDILSVIVRDYNVDLEAKGLERITADQVKAANPQLNRRSVQAGEILKIPIPPKKKKK